MQLPAGTNLEQFVRDLLQETINFEDNKKVKVVLHGGLGGEGFDGISLPSVVRVCSSWLVCLSRS